MNKKEPFFHIVKRDALPWYQAVGIRAVAIVLALVLCGILTTITTGIDPIEVYKSIFTGAFGTERKTWITLQNLSILLLIALALTPAFKMKFWNIGGEGQIIMGAIGRHLFRRFSRRLAPLAAAGGHAAGRHDRRRPLGTDPRFLQNPVRHQ